METIMNSQNFPHDTVIPPPLNFVDTSKIQSMNRFQTLNECLLNSKIAEMNYFKDDFVSLHDNNVGETSSDDVKLNDENFNMTCNSSNRKPEKPTTMKNIPRIVIDNVDDNTHVPANIGHNADSLSFWDSDREPVPVFKRRMGIIVEEPLDLSNDQSPLQSDNVERGLSFVDNKNVSTVPSDNDLDKLKLLTGKLNLQTRRPSYVQWKAEHLEKPLLVKLKPGKALDDIQSEQSMEERRTEIDRAIKWLRKELLDMRDGDQRLARQLVSLRHEISQLRLQQSCNQHEEMIDDAQLDLEEFGEISDVCDQPQHMRKVHQMPLRHLGVTAMNIATRRYSLC